jgi:hypothetical protein
MLVGLDGVLALIHSSQCHAEIAVAVSDHGIDRDGPSDELRRSRVLL